MMTLALSAVCLMPSAVLLVLVMTGRWQRKAP
jgi:hypothetical protein